MTNRAVEVPPWVSLDSSSGAPYYRQLYDGMRRAILSGLLPSGARLHSTRTLAAGLGVSCTTVVTAFEGLLAEGPGLGIGFQASSRGEMAGTEITGSKRYHQPRWGFAYGISLAAKLEADA